jgi:hypothetical protein
MAFLTAKEAKLYGLVVAGVTLLTLIGTLVFLLLSREPEPVSQPRTGRAESSAGAELLGEIRPAAGLVQKIRVPAEYTQVYREQWYPFRAVHSSWNQAQIERFWQDPRTLVREVLQKQSDREVEEFFEEIP